MTNVKNIALFMDGNTLTIPEIIFLLEELEKIGNIQFKGYYATTDKCLNKLFQDEIRTNSKLRDIEIIYNNIKEKDRCIYRKIIGAGSSGSSDLGTEKFTYLYDKYQSYYTHLFIYADIIKIIQLDKKNVIDTFCIVSCEGSYYFHCSFERLIAFIEDTGRNFYEDINKLVMKYRIKEVLSNELQLNEIYTVKKINKILQDKIFGFNHCIDFPYENEESHTIVNMLKTFSGLDFLDNHNYGHCRVKRTSEISNPTMKLGIKE